MVKIKLIPLTLLLCTQIGINNCRKTKNVNFAPGFDINSSPKMERLINAKETDPHQYPFQIAMIGKLNETAERKFVCSGSLISDEWILTAGHCFSNYSEIILHFGVHAMSEKFKPISLSHYKLKKADIIVHSDFDKVLLVNDIALIHLPQKIIFNETVGTVKLPSRCEGSSTFDNQTVTITGWGSKNATNFDEAPLSTSLVLEYVEIPIMPMSECKKLYLDYVKSTNICGKAVDLKAICYGDSGGPLLHKTGNVLKQIGLSSFGPESCMDGHPSVFTRIGAYLNWISNQTGIVIDECN